MKNKNLLTKCFLALVLIMSGQSAQAQSEVTDFGIFDHLSAGLTLGTTGIGLDVAAPITNYLQVRAGYDFCSGITHKEDMKYRSHGTKKETEVEGELNMSNAKLLLDVFPFRNVPFRFTTGFYLGTDEIITVENKTPVTDFDKGEGILVGDYIVGFNEQGYAKGAIKVNKFKPYVGLGFGRSVPRKRIGVSGDLGVQFWGEPGVYEKQTSRDLKIEKSDVGDGDEGAIETISKIKVYPVLSIRICGRIF